MSVKKLRPKVYIVGGGFEYIRLLFRLGCDGAKGLDDADIVLFTGGEDVDPQLYGEVPMAKTHYNPLRDKKEIAIYEECIKREIPMAGICRGGQFLNVMNGGKMWQHVNNHTRNHIARIEIPPFGGTKKKPIRRTINVTSTHHQMMIPHESGCVLLTALEATEKDGVGKSVLGKTEKAQDTEAVWYDATKCLCFQPHPEFATAPAELVDFFETLLEDFIFPNIPLNAMEKSIMAQAVPLPEQLKSVTPR